MAIVTHRKVSSGTVNTDVEVDLRDWNDSHDGIEHVDNTSDLDKPISTATQTALDAKANGAASALSRSNDTNVGLTLAGTPLTALLQPVSITVTWSGTLSAARGGFGADISASSGVPLFTTGTAAFTGTSGTGNFVRVTNAVLVTPALGTPSAIILTNGTGLPLAGLAVQAAYSIVGNFTNGSAVPTASTIGGLTQKASPAGTDLILIQDQASGQLKYATVSSVGASSGVSSIAGNTGAFTLANGIDNSTNQIQLTAARRTLPTTQLFTSGSGTYTLPANCLWIEIHMLGGGGGGAGGTTDGGAGGDTTWGTGPVFQAGGGGGSASAGASGGTVSGSGTPVISVAGAPGFTSPGNVAGAAGAAGGSSFYGGAGRGARGNGTNNGGSASANSGSGGGGGATTTTNFSSGASGAYLYAIINTPAATYSYAVGAAGTAGTGTPTGGAGGSGRIAVIEHYGS